MVTEDRLLYHALPYVGLCILKASRGVHTPKPMMHILPYFHKILFINFTRYLRKICTFSPISAKMYIFLPY